MAAIQDSTFVKLCAQLASRLSISLASARRRVDQAAAREGKRDLEGRRAMAQSMLMPLTPTRAVQTPDLITQCE